MVACVILSTVVVTVSYTQWEWWGWYVGRVVMVVVVVVEVFTRSMSAM